MFSTLRPTAKTFIPGNRSHVIKKISWHVKGITCVKYFNILDDVIGYDTAFPKGRQFLQKPTSKQVSGSYDTTINWAGLMD